MKKEKRVPVNSKVRTAENRLHIDDNTFKNKL